MKPFNGFEAFFDAPKNELYLGNGTHWYLFEEAPVSIFDVFAEDLDNDYLSRKGLELMGITDPIERLKKHIMCKFGGSDLRADIDENGKSHPDSPECPKAKTCPAFSLCCKLTVVANGTLAPEETRITRLLTTGLLNKEIAHLLHKSLPTVNTQCRNIERKMGVGNKPELIIEAMRLGIVPLYN